MNIQYIKLSYFCNYSVGGTVLAGGAAATGFGLLTGNNDITNAGLTSVLAGGALKGIGTLFGGKK